MFAVISRWEFEPSLASTVRESAEKMFAEMKDWEGVEMAMNVQIEKGAILAVIAYSDEATYSKLIQDENGPFAQAAQRHGIEQHAEWKWSERGEVDLAFFR